MSSFEEASRLKLRYDTPIGTIAVEDLWDVPLSGQISLDNLAKDLNAAVKVDGEESFVVKRSPVDAKLQLKFDIVKHVIAVKVSEAEEAENKAVVKDKKDRILAILSDDEALKGKTVEELKELLSFVIQQ